MLTGGIAAKNGPGVLIIPHVNMENVYLNQVLVSQREPVIVIDATDMEAPTVAAVIVSIYCSWIPCTNIVPRRSVQGCLLP